MCFRLKVKFGHFLRKCLTLAGYDVPVWVDPPSTVEFEFPEEEPAVKMNVLVDTFVNGHQVDGVQSFNFEWVDA
jgi:hypothetical protein